MSEIRLGHKPINDVDVAEDDSSSSFSNSPWLSLTLVREPHIVDVRSNGTLAVQIPTLNH